MVHSCYFGQGDLQLIDTKNLKSLFGDVAFSEYFLYYCRFLLLIVWRVRRTFFLPDDVFLPCDHGLDFVFCEIML